jgi:hypothetical protein
VKREHVATRSGACTFCPREDWPCRAYRLAIAVEESARLVQRKVLEAQLKLHNEICPFVEPCGRYEDLAAGLAALEER